MKKIFISLFVMAVAILAQAQTARDDFKRNIGLAGDNYTAYEVPQTKLSAAPKGYEPCYISHYGRHGSRYLIGKGVYDNPVKVLSEAEKDGKLTERGTSLLRDLKAIQADVQGHLEELTLLGAQQHQGIAQRMFDRLPGLFTGNAHVDAKSSIVVRCILSMTNELMELKAKNPNLDIRCDASAGDMQYIIQDDRELNAQKMPRGSEAYKAWHEYRERHFNPERLLNSLFNDSQYWNEKIRDKYEFCIDQLWKITSSIQGTEMRHTLSLYNLFTEEELYQIWLIRNANWYITYGPSPLNGGTQIYAQRNLIKKIIEEADAALAGSSNLTANLRFGHEVVVMPVVCFLNLNGYGTQYTDLEDVEKNKWYSYRIFPMGSNIQLVFYSKKKGSGDILVQILLNEEEATIPDLKPAQGCYYKWQDLRQYCLDKLARYTPAK